MRHHQGIFFFIAVCISGCAQVAVDLAAHDTPVPVLMNNEIGRPYTVVTHFEMDQDDKGLFLTRIFGGGQPDIGAMLRRQLIKTKGDAIINVRIKGEAKFGDVLLPVMVGIAGAFVHPFIGIFTVEVFFTDLKRFTVEGDIVRFTDAEQQQSVPKIDPMTGLPIREKPPVEFDPQTGLPKK